MTVEEMYAQDYKVHMLVSAAELEKLKAKLIEGGAMSHVEYEFAETGLNVADITIHVLGVKRITKTLKKQLEEA